MKNTSLLNYKIWSFDKLSSTNDYAKGNLSTFNDRDVIIAKAQEHGRGRFDRVWKSDVSDNLYMTIILKPTQTVDNHLPLANLTQYLSVILCEVLESYGVNASIKWPNDVLVDGKKIAGILSEASVKGTVLNGLVLGIGVNLNMSEMHLNKIDQPATSLNLFTKEEIDVDAFVSRLLDGFFKDYEEFLIKGFSFIADKYTTRSQYLGSEVVVNGLNRQDEGVAKYLDDNGALVIENKSGQTTIIIGDLVWKKA